MKKTDIKSNDLQIKIIRKFKDFFFTEEKKHNNQYKSSVFF